MRTHPVSSVGVCAVQGLQVGHRCPHPSPGQLSQRQHISLVSPVACGDAGTCPQALGLPAVVSPTDDATKPM